MTVRDFYTVFDSGKESFVMIIDSAVKSQCDAIIEKNYKSESVLSMEIDRITFFRQPNFIVQWSDCMQDFQCESQCNNVLVIFAHKTGQTPVTLALKEETVGDIWQYCKEINDKDHHN
jgi:hypothetical protein